MKATIAQKLTIDSESSVEPQQDTTGKSAGTSAKDMVSVAVAVAVVTNTATATVDGGAQPRRAARDAGHLRRLVPVPDALRPVHPAFVGRARRQHPQRGLRRGHEVHRQRRSGSRTLLQQLVDEHRQGRQGGDRRLRDRARAHERLRGDRRVERQDQPGRRLARRDEEPARTIEQRQPGSDAGGLEGEQVVSIEATNYQQFVDMVGIFSLPDIDLDTKGASFKDRLSLNPVGTGGSKGGFGGAFYISVQNNTTHAIVEDGVKVYSGVDGGFNMKAEEALFPSTSCSRARRVASSRSPARSPTTGRQRHARAARPHGASHGPRRAPLRRRPDDAHQLGRRDREGRGPRHRHLGRDQQPRPQDAGRDRRPRHGRQRQAAADRSNINVTGASRCSRRSTATSRRSASPARSRARRPESAPRRRIRRPEGVADPRRRASSRRRPASRSRARSRSTSSRTHAGLDRRCRQDHRRLGDRDRASTTSSSSRSPAPPPSS